MNTTELIRPPAPRRRAPSLSDAGHHVSTSRSETQTVGEMFAESIPLVGAIAGYGPPVIFLAGPWLLLGLVLAGPFAFLLVLVAAMLLAATALVALAAVVVGTPYLLVRQLRSSRARRAVGTRRAAQLVPVRPTRVTA